MSVIRMLGELLAELEVRLYDEPLNREMLSDVAYRLTFAVDQLDALIRNSSDELKREQALRLAQARCASATEGINWVREHAGAEEETLFDQLHVAFQEVRATLTLLDLR